MHIREAVSVEAFELLPSRRGIAPAGSGKTEQAIIDKLLEPYRTAPQGRLGNATLLRIAGRELLEDLADDEADAALRFGELVAFSGLSARTLFDQIGYANRDNFRLIVQRSDDPASGLRVLHDVATDWCYVGPSMLLNSRTAPSLGESSTSTSARFADG